jgi:hypothetical protein
MSNIIEQLRGLKSDEVWLATATSLATIVSGWMTVLLYHPEWIQEWATAKLIITSISITLPVTAMAVVAIVRNENVDQHEVLFVATSCTFISFSVGLLIAYLFEIRFRIFLLILSILMYALVRFGSNLITGNKSSNKALQSIGDKSPQTER